MTTTKTDPDDALLAATIGLPRGEWHSLRVSHADNLRYWLCRCGFARTATTTCPLCREEAPK